MSFERLAAEQVFAGKIFDVCQGSFRHADGATETRQWVTHPGAVGVVAHDGERVWLVRQPREAVGEPALLELPAGKLDEAGESPLDCGRRELIEEIGKSAAMWELLTRYFSSAGFTDEEVHVYLATDLTDAPGHAIEGERITIEARPLAELDAVIAECRDAKTLIGLLLLRARLGAAAAQA
jgi:8-oxo-dGTP pyrophosphatase MutT (NUDIX family)